MRFIHTADWHLGRLFHGVHLTDDQAHVLAQFVRAVRDLKPDLVLIAGDVYDRAIPPPEAVKLLDDVLSELVLDLDVPVLLIAGNHDSPGRLNFAKRLLAGRKLYVAGTLAHPCEPLVLHDAHGPVEFFPVPYAEPGMVRQCLGGCDAIVDHNTAMRHYLDAIRTRNGHASRKVVIAHAFVAGGTECDSERPLSVGGAGTVDAACFANFDYVALGHLHAPQVIRDESNRDHIRYCGSLLKYSFDEAAHAKTFYVVDMAPDGACAVTPIDLTPRRDVRRLRGLMADLLAGPQDGSSADDYLEVTLLDDGPVIEAMGQLRAVYPNVLTLRRPEKESPGDAAHRPTIDDRRHLDLFREFFAHATGDPITPDQEAAYAAVAEQLMAAEREATCP